MAVEILEHGLEDILITLNTSLIRLIVILGASDKQLATFIELNTIYYLVISHDMGSFNRYS